MKGFKWVCFYPSVAVSTTDWCKFRWQGGQDDKFGIFVQLQTWYRSDLRQKVRASVWKGSVTLQPPSCAFGGFFFNHRWKPGTVPQSLFPPPICICQDFIIIWSQDTKDDRHPHRTKGWISIQPFQLSAQVTIGLFVPLWKVAFGFTFCYQLFVVAATARFIKHPLLQRLIQPIHNFFPAFNRYFGMGGIFHNKKFLFVARY